MSRLIDAHELGNKGFVVFKQACDAAPNEEVFKAVNKMGGEFEKLIKNAPTIDALPLRCHMGDTVWVVGTKCLSGLYEDECRTKHGVEACDICPLDRTFIVFPMVVIGYLFLYIHGLEDSPLFRWGETVFKTQEEAEAALAKMKEADHGK